MAQRVIRDTVISPQLSIGDRGASTTVTGDIELFKSSGNADIAIVTVPTAEVNLNFNDGTSNVGVIKFDHVAEEFEVSINSTPVITTTGTATTVHGNLTVEGTTTTVDSTVVAIADNVFLLNKDEAGAGVTLGTSGFEVERGTVDNTGWFYNETENFWCPAGPGGALGSPPTNAIGNISTIDTTDAGDSISIIGTGALGLPVGTTAQRPTGAAGELRFNSTLSELEAFDGSSWIQIVALTGGLSSVTSDFVNVTGDTMTGDLTMDSGAQIFSDGDAGSGAPAISFDNDTDTGLFRIGDGSIGVSSNGSLVATFDSTGFVFSSDTDLGGNVLSNVADPTAGDEVGDRDYNDGRYVQRDGSNTITGNILPDNPSINFGGTGLDRFDTIFAVTFDGTATAALYSDLAEKYAADALYEPGTVVVFGGEAEITISTLEKDTAVAGIISTQPGFKLNKDAGPDDTHPYLALKGRVPCKVVGWVKKGDLLITSDTPGHAKSVGRTASMPYTVIAKAIEDHKSDGRGVIEVFVM